MFILKYLTALLTEDPTKELKEEHEHFRALLKAAEKTTVRSKVRRKEIFADMDALLSLHEDVEEKILYAMLKRHAETKDIVQEGLQEHHVCDVLAKELRSMPVTHKDWGSKFHVLGESLEHHLGEEEDSMFPRVKKVLSAKELKELAAKMHSFRKRRSKRVQKQHATVRD